jgi:hypothetical protein
VSEDPRRFIFVHIPKTAGSTLRAILRRQYRPDEIFQIGDYDVPGSLDRFLSLDESLRDRVRVIQGHIPFGMHEAIPHEWRYVSLVRHPVARIVSHYRYVLRTPTLRQHDEVAGAAMTLKQYVTSAQSARFFNNGQVRYLGASNFRREGVASSAHLERALENASTHFSVLGPTEAFDEALILLKRQYGWTWPYYERRNVAPRKDAVQEFDAGDLDVILELNELDLRLYEHVRSAFAERLSQQDETFWSELSDFRHRQTEFEASLPSQGRIQTLWRKVFSR